MLMLLLMIQESQECWWLLIKLMNIAMMIVNKANEYDDG